jgi:hypothetical protein
LGSGWMLVPTAHLGEKMRDWQNFFSKEEMQEIWEKTMISTDGNVSFRELVNAKICEAIQSAPKVYGNSQANYTWTALLEPDDNMAGSIVDVKPIKRINK